MPALGIKPPALVETEKKMTAGREEIEHGDLAVAGCALSLADEIAQIASRDPLVVDEIAKHYRRSKETIQGWMSGSLKPPTDLQQGIIDRVVEVGFCTCLERSCYVGACKGECGCYACHMIYAAIPRQIRDPQDREQITEPLKG